MRQINLKLTEKNSRDLYAILDEYICSHAKERDKAEPAMYLQSYLLKAEQDTKLEQHFEKIMGQHIEQNSDGY